MCGSTPGETILPCPSFVHTRRGAAYFGVQGWEGSDETLGDGQGGVRECLGSLSGRLEGMHSQPLRERGGFD